MSKSSSRRLASTAAAAKAGSVEDFGKLYTQFYAPLHSFAQSCCRHFQESGLPPPLEEPEDMVQSAFCRAWESIEHLREPSAFLGWLRRILYGISRRCFEQQTRRSKMHLKLVKRLRAQMRTREGSYASRDMHEDALMEIILCQKSSMHSSQWEVFRDSISGIEAC